ncbi:lytic transglycosylase domain-containing protein [Roseospira marina]|uniref:Lytic transglycosylase domain-containing protein n=1 Tax=Roseospira marina TaxID=140057 RepID=A0A5M6IEJ7_9PROT|nr:lytic transglycosylase domain-containing protein [Roseospira marina]KAA5606711.1 lytic transglycosylase domain-containing protein [Roseospira marina]MBB4313874.1 soluble lytic murein transglycosylase [Roseospira marina]MBB5087036.1 soluble lytic murein transglycosylase [Roseospira marina]
MASRWTIAATRPARRRGTPAILFAACVAVSLAAVGPLRPGPALAQIPPYSGPFGAALEALQDRDYDTALALAGRLGDPVARKVVEWARLKDGLGSFAAISGFLEANPGWPHSYALRRSAERALTGLEDPRRVIAWFKRYPPLTTDGRVAHARALSAAGQHDAARDAARDAWIHGHFTHTEAVAFLDVFRGSLRPRDHNERLSELLWDQSVDEARRLMPLVDDGHQRLAEARIRLMTNAAGVDAAIDRVPRSLRDDPGLVYDRLVWRRKRDLYDRAVELLSHPSANLGRPDAWAYERAYLGREALQRGHVTRAYEIFANHGQDRGVGFATGEWMAGWILLRFLREPAKALPHFETMHAGVSYPQSLSRAAYWAGRAASALGQRDRARDWYRKAAQHAETFYGQLAVEALGERLGDHLDARPPVTDADRARFAADERVHVIELMDQAGFIDAALPFILALNDDDATPGFRLLAADAVARTDRPDMAVFFARRAALAGTMLPQAGYPLPPDVLTGVKQAPVAGDRPEPALLLGLIRQESNFNAEAVSRAGARGLMQLMPSTAQRMAQRLGESSSPLRLVTDPGHNARLGTAYFASLLDDFRGSYVLAIAGYNAGPQRSVQWMRENGDPRRMDVEQVIDWIEMIPFSETRNYVQRVLEGAQVYRHRLGEASADATLARDLQR